jgi:hypothetical protein
VDVSAAFNDALNDPLFQSRITVTGVTEVAGIQMPMEGLLEVRPGATHSVMQIATPSGSQVTEQIVTGGRTYELQQGVWFDTGPANTGSDLGNAIRELGGFRDTGVGARNGVDLHHMELPANATLPASAIGLDDPGLSKVVISVEGWATADGKPAILAIAATWVQAVGEASTEAQMTMELAFKGVSVTIRAPEDLWVRYTSKAHKYAVAYPAEWDVDKGTAKKADFFNSWDGSWYGASRAKRRGFSLNQIVSATARDLGDVTGLKGAKLDANKPAKVDGVKARRLTFHGTYAGDRMWAVMVLVVKGDYVYVIEYYLYQKPTEELLTQFDTCLGTFDIK